MGGAVGMVPLEDRGDLPLVELHGEPMFLHPVRALHGAAQVRRVVVTCAPGDVSRVERLVARRRLAADVVPHDRWWSTPTAGAALVLCDPLCPLVPSTFVDRVVETALDGAAAGYRPVTDTVKTVVDERIAGTLDRDRLAVVASPVVVPAGLAGQRPPVHDFALLATWLRERGSLTLVKAPSMARRVGDESAVRVLECVDELGRRVHEA